MKNRLIFLIAITLIFTSVSCLENVLSSSATELEDGVFTMVNEHRVSIGMNELVLEEIISNESRTHSQNMAEGKVAFSHDGFSDRADRIYTQFGGNAAGENVGKEFATAKAAVDWWLNSPDHKANIEGDFTHSGVGVWQHNGGDFYFTQIFIKK